LYFKIKNFDLQGKCAEIAAVEQACLNHLVAVIGLMRPSFLIPCAEFNSDRHEAARKNNGHMNILSLFLEKSNFHMPIES
jgi:hypothetical protein